MLDKATLLLFLPAMLAITLTPGTDTMFVVASALGGGPKRGVLAAVGIISGGIVHLGAAAVGVTALVLGSAVIFTTVKFVGAVYLIYLGIRIFADRRPLKTADAPVIERTGPQRTVFRGFVTNVTNPKVALFVMAFLPQFVAPTRGPVWLQILELGAIWYGAALLWLSVVGVLVGSAAVVFAPSPRIVAWLRYAMASVFVALGARLALTTR